MNILSLKPGGGKWSASGGPGLLPPGGPAGGANGSKRAPGGTAPLWANASKKCAECSNSSKEFPVLWSSLMKWTLKAVL